MDENKDMSLEDFQRKIRGLRSTTTFDIDLDDIQTFLGLPKNDEDDIPMESLLIGVTKICYKNTIKADAVLAALGLLKEFDNRCGDEELSEEEVRALLIKRRIKFLQRSSYLETKKVKGTLYNSYEQLINDKATDENGKTAFDTAISTLGTNDGRYIDTIAKKLYENRSNLQRYIEKGKEYLDESGKNINLPSLCSIRKTATTTQYESGSMQQSIIQNHSTTKKEKVSAEIIIPDGVAISITGPKSKKTEMIMAAIYKFAAEELIAMSFLLIVLIIFAVKDYNSFNERNTEFTTKAPDSNSDWISEATGLYRNEENSGINQPFAEEVDLYSLNPYFLPITKPYLKIAGNKNKSDTANIGGHL